MQMMYCWRCDEVVPMLDEAEFAQISETNAACVEAVQRYRREHEAPLAEVPLDEFYRPVREKYEEMTGASGYSSNQILKHRLSLYGPPCRNCGKPLRTPRAKMCAACGERRAA